MRYKLVAIDMDGTLLNNKHEISKENIDTIKLLKKKGIKFVIVTGRPDLMVKEYIEILELTAPILGSNGATIRDVFTGELFSVKDIKKETLVAVFKFFKEKNIYPRIYSLDEVYTFNEEEFQDKKNPFINSVKKLQKKMKYLIVKDSEELLKENKKIIRITYPNYNEEILISLQKELKKIDGIEVVRGTKYTLDIMGKNVSKGDALCEYIKSIEILKEEVIAIGDAENDISMLELVGFPITMENGEEKLKKIARMVSLSNENSGVAYALKKIFNII